MKVKEVKILDGTAVRCESEQCEAPALFLFIAAGASGACRAYCETHASQKMGEWKVKPPRALAAGATQ